MLSYRQRAEDLAQEVFLRLYRNLPSISSAAHLTFWLRKVTVNGAIDRLRRDDPYETVPLEVAADLVGAAPDADPLLARHLRLLLQQLAPAPRAVLLLRYQEDLDPTEIA